MSRRVVIGRGRSHGRCRSGLAALLLVGMAAGGAWAGERSGVLAVSVEVIAACTTAVAAGGHATAACGAARVPPGAGGGKSALAADAGSIARGGPIAIERDATGLVTVVY